MKKRNYSGNNAAEFLASTDSRRAIFSIFSESSEARSLASSDLSIDSCAAASSSASYAAAGTSVDASASSASAANKEPPSIHPEFQFFDPTGKFYCRVYFAENFRLFRQARLGRSGGEERFVRSLTRCVPWAAKGGKSGSNFCKTVDDRFILKQMSRFEMQSFLDFGPHYFNHLVSMPGFERLLLHLQNSRDIPHRLFSSSILNVR